MQTLTISFSNLALFAHRADGLTVLLPKHHHALAINGQARSFSGPLRLQKTMGSQRTPVVGPTATIPDPTRSVSLNDLFPGQQITLRPAEELDAMAVRIELGGGSLLALEPQLAAGFEHLSERAWEFGSHERSRLTNRKEFTLPMEAGAEYALVDADGVPVTELPPGNPVITIENTEGAGSATTLQLFKDTGNLEEFATLYELVKVGGVVKAGPVPHTDVPVRPATFSAGQAVAGTTAPPVSAVLAFFDCEVPFCPTAHVTAA